VQKLLYENAGRAFELHREHVNPQWARVLRTIGFDRTFAKAQGQYLWDVEGNKYLDFLGGYAVANIGRNHPTVRRALVDLLQTDHPSMVQFETPLLSGLLAEELKKRIGRGLDYVFFTNSGTEGIEAAIKFAKCSTGRPGIVFAAKAFHGLSSGSLSINGDEGFRDGFGPLLPHCRSVPFDDLPALEHALVSHDVAAFIVEPIQGKGVNMPSPGYLAEAARICHRHGSLFVVDEVQTGIGRTGRFLAIDHEEGVEPDIIVLAKALSGAHVPVGAVLSKRSVWDQVFSSMERAIVHSSTFHQGSLAMMAGLASLKALDEDDLVANAKRMGQLLMDGLHAMKSKFEFIHNVRGRGLMIGLEFGPPRSLALRTGWSLIHAMDDNLFPQAVVLPLMDDHRIITQVAGHHIDVIKLIPPLCINEDDVRWFLSGFEDVMRKLHQFPGPIWEVLKKLGKHAVTKRSREPVPN